MATFTFISLPVGTHSDAINLHSFLTSRSLSFTKVSVPLQNWSSFGGLIELSEGMRKVMNEVEIVMERMRNVRSESIKFIVTHSREKSKDKKNLNSGKVSGNSTPSNIIRNNNNFDINTLLSTYKYPSKYNLPLSSLSDQFSSDLCTLRRNWEKRVEGYEKRRKIMEKKEREENGSLKERKLDFILSANYCKEIDYKIGKNTGNSTLDLQKSERNITRKEDLLNVENNFQSMNLKNAETNNGKPEQNDFKNFFNEKTDEKDQKTISEEKEELENSSEIKNEPENINFLCNLFIVRPVGDLRVIPSTAHVGTVITEGSDELVHLLGLDGKIDEIKESIREYGWILKEYENDDSLEDIAECTDLECNYDSFISYTHNFHTFIDTYFLECLDLLTSLKLCKLYVDSQLRYGLSISCVFLFTEEDEKDWNKAINKYRFCTEVECKTVPREKIVFGV